MPGTTFDEFVESLPSTKELRRRLAQNLEERDLIKRTLKLAEQKERVDVHAEPLEVTA